MLSSVTRRCGCEVFALSKNPLKTEDNQGPLQNQRESWRRVVQKDGSVSRKSALQQKVQGRPQQPSFSIRNEMELFFESRSARVEEKKRKGLDDEGGARPQDGTCPQYDKERRD